MPEFQRFDPPSLPHPKREKPTRRSLSREAEWILSVVAVGIIGLICYLILRPVFETAEESNRAEAAEAVQKAGAPIPP